MILLSSSNSFKNRERENYLYWKMMHYGMGYGGQFIFLFPSEDLVIVTTHNHDTADGIDQQVQFLTNYLAGLVANYSKK